MSQVNIIGGKFRGKKINFHDIPDLRPTPNRVKETLFNWLMQDINDSNCLDLFAGSGALGFEAFSRGASKVVMIEKNKNIYKNLCKIQASFPENSRQRLQIINTDASSYLLKFDFLFDIIFLDPPFTDNYEKYLKLIEHNIKNSGLLYIESSKEIHPNKKFWKKLRIKRAGDVTFALYLFDNHTNQN